MFFLPWQNHCSDQFLSMSDQHLQLTWMYCIVHQVNWRCLWLFLEHWPVTALSNCSSIIVNALSITVLASGACENVLTKDLETQDGHTFCWSGSISQCIASPDTVLSIFSSLTLWLFAKDFDNTRWTHILMQWANKSMLSQSIHSVAHLLLFKSMVVFTQILVTYYTSTSQPPFQLNISSGTYTVL